MPIGGSDKLHSPFLLNGVCKLRGREEDTGEGERVVQTSGVMGD